MKRRHKRLSFIFITIVALGLATTLILLAFKENIVFFLSPTEVIYKSSNKEIQPKKRIRVGGLVEKGSVKIGKINRFRITDLKQSIEVEFRGILPDLFREGQGVVAEGFYAHPIFTATVIMAKHDETYMPPEVAEALKKSGKWKPAGKR